MATQEPLPRRRAACDRCHGHKLRCLKSHSGDICIRCQKAGAQCVFSIAKRYTRQKPFSERDIPKDPNAIITTNDGISNMTIDPQDLGATFHIDQDIDQGFVWDNEKLPPRFQSFDAEMQTPEALIQDRFNSFTTFNPVFPDPTTFYKDMEPSLPLQLDALNEHGSSLVQSEGSKGTEDSSTLSVASSTGSDRASVQMQLSKLSKQLIEHMETIPPLSIHEPRQVEQTGQILPSIVDDCIDDPSQIKTNFTIDSSFHLTTTLIELLSALQVSGQHLDPKLKSTAAEKTTPFVASTRPYSSDEQSINSPDRHVTDSLNYLPLCDHASVLLALSCHHQLVNIWKTLFLHTKSMAENGVFQRPGFGTKAPCSQLKIGSFAPSSSKAAAALVVVVIADLIVALLHATRQLLDHLKATLSQSATDIELVEIVNSIDPISSSAGSLEVDTLKATVVTCEAAWKQSLWLKNEFENIQQIVRAST